MKEPATAAPAGTRPVWSLCLVAVLSLLGYGYYAQHVLYLDPCPLCITQRAFYMGVGAASLIGLLGARRTLWRRGAAVLAGLCAAGGIATAGRQVWLQHLPKDQVPECGPGLQYWLENMPILETVSLLFRGDGNCAEVQWTFLGFSMGEWSLAWFVLFFVTALVMLLRAGRRTTVSNTAGAPRTVRTGG